MARKEEVEVKMALSGKACKTTCKVINILAKIGEILLMVGAVALAIAGVFLGIAQKDIKVNEIIEAAQSEVDSSVVTITGPAIDNFLAKTQNEQIVFILVTIALGAVVLFLMSVLMRYIYRFFKNLEKGRTPFTLENVDILQRMATWLFATIITIDLGSLLLSAMIGGAEVGMSVSLSYYAMGFALLVLAVVFRHGYELEQKVKEKK